MSQPTVAAQSSNRSHAMLGLSGSSSLARAASSTAADFAAAESALGFCGGPTNESAAAVASEFASPRPISTCTAAALQAG